MNQSEFVKSVKSRLKLIYGDLPLPDNLFSQFLDRIESLRSSEDQIQEKWNEKDIILITYGDSIKSSNQTPLKTLKTFLDKHLERSVNTVHILPFFPYSSDDGFSVIDYLQVNPDLGTWDDIAMITQDYSLMADLVINHISKQSSWFRNYLEGKDPGRNFFIEVDPAVDLSKVVRPRSLPLLSPFETIDGRKYLWTTFSEDQIDLNFGNPEVLFEMMNVLLHYFEKGARIIRLDAIAFLWKEIGTSCLHLPQTHEIVKLMGDIAKYIDPKIIIITETNVPNLENLSYFGSGDEAHMVYQFSLPPLLLHALYSSNSKYLAEWAKGLSNIPEGCTFFNFTASHDGIGIRPLEGILPDKEILLLAEAMKSYGGYVSTKRNTDGTDSPYELNITYLDALKYTARGEDNLQVDRFICSQTIMMSFIGIPAFYIHSLLGTHNFNKGVEVTGMPRTVNRRKWTEEELYPLLEGKTDHSRILEELKRRIAIRKGIVAFHPDGRQEVIDIRENLFAFTRGDNSQLLVIANISPDSISLGLNNLSIKLEGKRELLSDQVLENVVVLDAYQVMWVENK